MSTNELKSVEVEEQQEVEVSESGLRRRTSAVRRWRNRLVLRAALLHEKVFIKRHTDSFYLIFGGHVYFETLHSAVELDLFSLLYTHGRLTEEEIARYLKLQVQPCRILLLGLTATKILRKRGRYYSNSLIAKMVLCRQSEKSLIAYVKLQHHVYYPGVRWFYDSLKENRNVGLKEFKGTEPTLYQRLSHHPDLEFLFQQAMQELSRQTNELFAKFIDLSGVKHLIDVGGGNASNIIALAKVNPHLKASVFEFPNVADIALSKIFETGMRSRLGVIKGNVFTDPLPSGADCFLFCHFFTIWSKAEDLRLLKRAFEALPSGGRAMIFNMMQTDDRRGPLSAGLGSPYFLSIATGKGMLYTWEEYETLFREAGFTKISRQKLPRDHGVICGIKP